MARKRVVVTHDILYNISNLHNNITNDNQSQTTKPNR